MTAIWSHVSPLLLLLLATFGCTQLLFVQNLKVLAFLGFMVGTLELSPN